MFFAVAAPFSAAPSALADPKPPPRAHVYNVTLSCTTIDGLASFQSGWKWYQGGINGTVLASGSLTNGTPPRRRRNQQRHFQRNPASERQHPVRLG